MPASLVVQMFRPAMRGRALGIGAMLSFVMVTRLAVAQALAAQGAAAKELERLKWTVADGAVGCPDAAEFRRRLEGRIGTDPFASTTTPAFEVRLRRERGKFVADIRQSTDGDGSSRSIGGDASTCDQLVDAVALAFSLLLETNPAEVASNQPKARADRPALVCPRTDCPTGPAFPKRDNRSAWLSVGPAFAHNEFPVFAPGGMLATGLALAAPWELTAGAAYFGVVHAEVEGVGAAFTLAEFWLGLGITLPLAGRLRWRAQLAPVLGVVSRFRDSPTSLSSAAPAYSRLWGVRLASQATLRVLGPLGIAVGVSGELPGKRWDFRVLDAGNERVIWTAARVGVRSEILLDWEMK